MKISLTFNEATPADLRRLADAIEGVASQVSAAPAMPAPAATQAPAMPAPAATQAPAMPAPAATQAPAMPFPTVAGVATQAPAMPFPTVAGVVQPAGAIPMPTNPGGDDDDDDEGAPSTAEPDSEGIRYDERIHADPPSQTAKGAWRKKRGADKALIAQIEAAQKSGNSAPMQPAAMPQVQQQPAAMPQVQQQPAAMPQVQQQPAPAPAPTGQLDFQTFMVAITNKMQQQGADGKPVVSMEYLQRVTAEISQAFQRQLSTITDIATEPNMITYAVQILQRDQRW